VLALAQDLAVPVQRTRLERAQDRIRRARDLARAVDVFDANEPLAALGARV